MKVRERMSPNPVTIEPGVSVDQALKAMRENKVRHLLVMQEGKLAGMVTDMDLSSAWFPSLLEEVSVENVMRLDPLTVQADDTVYQAARLLHRHRITGLPVLDGEKLVGIITIADILGVLVEVLGLLEETSRLDVELRGGVGQFQELMSLVRQKGAEVLSVALISSKDDNRVYSFRLKRTDMAPIEKALAQAGHRVLS